MAAVFSLVLNAIKTIDNNAITMPIRHKKHGKKRNSFFPIEIGARSSIAASAADEGLAIAVARQWLPIKRSKAQVKRRGKGLKYNLHGKPKDKRVHVARIRDWDNWQFGDNQSPDLSGIVGIQPIERWRDYMPIDPTPKKLLKEKQLSKEIINNSLEEMLAKMVQIKNYGASSLIDRLSQ